MLRKYKVTLLTLTLMTFLFSAARSAKADVVRLASQSELDPAGTTATYTGTDDTLIASPYALAAGDNRVTFRLGLSGASFYRFDSDGTNTAFDAGTKLIDTNGSYGALNVSFRQGVSEFGLGVQSSGVDLASFTLNAYSGGNRVISFTTALIDNSSGSGALAFLGVRALGGEAITRFTVSSLSSDPAFSDFFIVGPVSFKTTSAEPIPEPATMLLLGTGLAGIGATLRRQKVKRRTQE